MMKFKDKVVLVTGANQNTGFAIARRFLEEGAIVMINSEQSEGLELAYDALNRSFPGQVERFAADISDEEEVVKMFHVLDETCGQVDILVNNACNQGIGPSFDELDSGNFNKVIQVNLFGTFLVSKQAIKRMLRKEDKGVIVNIGSNVSKRAIHNRAAYVASKAGVDGLTKAMAVDLGPKGIRVNTIAPGYIHTDRWNVISDDIKTRRRTNIPLGKEAYGEDIANAVLFMASEGSKAINGSRLVIDGGCAAQHMPIDVDF